MASLGVILAGMPALAIAAEQGGHGGGAAHPPQPLLLSDPGMMVWTLLLFGLLMVVLGKLVWPPILQGLQAREEKIRTDISQAEAANQRAQQTLADYEKRLADAHAEARKLIDQGRADAENVRARLAAQTEADIHKMRDRAKAEILQARHQAVQDLYAKAAELSVAVAEKILQRQVTDADTQAMVERSLKEMDRLKVG